MADLQDQVVALDRVFSWADEAGIAAILAGDDDAAIEHLLTRLRADLPPADETVELLNAIIAAVESDEELATVAAVARACGRSERWLQQTFRDYLGIGIKWLLQRRRMLAAAARIRGTADPNWAAIAYDMGYSSQQHFITDFTTVLGCTPRQYRKALTR